MLKKTSLLTIVLAALCCVSSAYAQKRGPSTQGEISVDGRVAGQTAGGDFGRARSGRNEGLHEKSKLEDLIRVPK